jgi:hypothetical protein
MNVRAGKASQWETS